MNEYLFSNDYSADSLNWIKKVEKKNLNQKNNEIVLEEFQKEIIQENNSSLAYFFAYEYRYKSHLMQKIILDNKDPKYSCLFAQDIENSDIKALQKIIIDAKKIKYICHFACFVKGADLKLLEQLIIKSKNIKYIHMYIKHIKNANINDFKEIIFESKKPRYLFELAKHLSDEDDLERVEDLIIESGSFVYMRLLAAKIKKINVEKIEQAILDINNVEEIEKFAKCVKKSKMKRFLLVL